MGYVTAPKFWKCYGKLPEETRRAAIKSFELWKADPRHRSLYFKKIGRDHVSIRVGLGYRAIGRLTPNLVIWTWIGPHSEYDQMIKRL